MVFFNGEDIGMDSKQDVIYYLIENGLDEHKVYDIKFHEKGYGFLRNWMDSGVPEFVIIKTLRLLLQQKLRQSDESTDTELSMRYDDYDLNRYGVIYLPPDISIAELKTYNKGYICGGGEHECSKEILILMNTFNIKYKILSSFVY